jgi:hypothetical protein
MASREGVADPSSERSTVWTVEERENQGMGERRLYIWGKFFLSNAINAGSF